MVSLKGTINDIGSHVEKHKNAELSCKVPLDNFLLILIITIKPVARSVLLLFF